MKGVNLQYKQFRDKGAWTDHSQAVKNWINANIKNPYAILSLTEILGHYDNSCITHLYYDEAKSGEQSSEKVNLITIRTNHSWNDHQL